MIKSTVIQRPNGTYIGIIGATVVTSEKPTYDAAKAELDQKLTERSIKHGSSTYPSPRPTTAPDQ